MSERRLYIDPDKYQIEVLVPAIRAAEPNGEDVEVIDLSQPDSERAREDGVEPHETPVYVFREGDEVAERFDGYRGVRSVADGETHDRLAHEHELLDERGKMRFQAITSRKCIHCNQYADAWVHDSELGGYLCEPCAEDEYGLPAEEWYDQPSQHYISPE